jgi:hypothetical protein
MYFLLVLFPSVSAQPLSMPRGLGAMFENIFRTLFDILGRDMVMLGVTFIAFFMILYAIVLAGTKRITMFKGQDGGANGQGKAFAIAFALLSTVGIFFSIRSNIYETVRRIHEVMGNLGILLIGITVYMLLYYGTRQGDQKNPCVAMLAASISMFLMSYIIEDYGWMGLATILFIIGLICLIVRGFGLFRRISGAGRGSGRGGGSGGSGRGSGRGTRGTPREIQTDVQVHVTDGSGNNITGAVVEAKHSYRGWRNKGVTNANGLCTFRMRSGMRSIRATHGGITGGGRFNLLPNIVNNCPIILGAGPGGSGRIYGTITDINTGVGIGNVHVQWNGLGTRSNPDGTYSFPVPVANFGSHNITANAGNTYNLYTSTMPVVVSTASPNQPHPIQLQSLSPIVVTIEFDYGSGVYTPLLIPNQTGVIVRITSTTVPFTNANLSRFEIQSTIGNVVYTGALLVPITPTEYRINNVDTINCIGVRYIFV